MNQRETDASKQDNATFYDHKKDIMTWHKRLDRKEEILVSFEQGSFFNFSYILSFWVFNWLNCVV